MEPRFWAKKQPWVVALVIALCVQLLQGLGYTPRAYAAAVYEVGPGQAYTEIGQVPWQSLQPGDTVRIHWRSAPYKEMILLSRSGTADAPITVEGVPGPDGQLPVLDAENGVWPASANHNYTGTAARGLIVVGLRRDSVRGDKPRHLVIQNLDLRGAHRNHTFTMAATGETMRFVNAAAGVMVERGEFITIRGNIIRDNSNGIFVASGPEEAMVSRQILIEANYIYDNGNAGSENQHGTYTEADGIIYQYNYFGPPKEGTLGNALKDRSAGTVVRYNFFHRGAHSIDLVEASEGFPMLGGKESYRKTYVYGNVLYNDPGYSGTMVHYGGDEWEPDYRHGTLYFYNNTVVIKHDQSEKWRTTLIQAERDHKIDFRNNIIYRTSTTPGATPTDLNLMSFYGDIEFGKNWVSPGYRLGRDEFSGTAVGLENLMPIPGNDPRFVDPAAMDFRLLADSGAIDQSEVLEDIPDKYQLINQFTRLRDPLLGELRPTLQTPVDFGAFEYGPSGLPVWHDPEPFPIEDTPVSEPLGEDTGSGANGNGAIRPDPVVPPVPVPPQPAADAPILYVDGANETGRELGTVDAPYATIQSAVQAAPAGAVIRAAQGLYEEYINLGAKTIYLYGGYAGATSEQYETGAAGDFSRQDPAEYTSEIRGDRTAAVVRLNGSSATIDGFTIRNGLAGIHATGGVPLIANNEVADNGTTDWRDRGGGLKLENASATIRGNSIHHNTAGRGAGMSVTGSGSVEIVDNDIAYNEGYDDHGGGVYIGTDGFVTGNRIHHNSTGIHRGYGWGGGLIAFGTNRVVKLSGNRVYENYAATHGGGEFIDEGAIAVIENELIYRNRARQSGAGLLVDGSGNGTPGNGVGSIVTLRNSTIADNTADTPYYAGTGLYVSTISEIDIENTIFWNNSNGDIRIGATSSASIRYSNTIDDLSLIGGLTSGEGNTRLQPGFVDSAAGDYRLISRAGRWDEAGGDWIQDEYDSPLIDRGNPASAYETETASNGGRVNMGAYGNTSTASRSSDTPVLHPDAGNVPTPTPGSPGAGGQPSGPGNSGNPGSGNNNGGPGAGQSPAPEADPVLYTVFDKTNNISFTSGSGQATVMDKESGSDSLAIALTQFSNAWAVPKQIRLQQPIPLSEWKAGDKLRLQVRMEGTAQNSNPVRLIVFFNGNTESSHRVRTQNLPIGSWDTVSLDLSGIIANLGESITQIGVMTGYGWMTDAAVHLANIEVTGTGAAWDVSAAGSNEGSGGEQGGEASSGGGSSSGGQGTGNGSSSGNGSNSGSGANSGSTGNGSGNSGSTPTPGGSSVSSEGTLAWLLNRTPTVQFVGSTGTAETRIKPETGSLAVRLAEFPNAWSVPRQLKLNEPVSLEKWKPGDKLELKVKLSGTAAGSAPTRLLFYFNGDSGSGTRIQSSNLTLNEEQTVQLDLAGIIANLGGSLKQIGVMSGYGWPTGAELELSDIRFVGRGEPWSYQHLLGDDLTNFTFTAGHGTASAHMRNDGLAAVMLSGFPNAWAAPKQIRLEQPVSLSSWKPGDRLEFNVRMSGTATSSAPVRLLVYFNGESSTLRVQTPNLTLGEEQLVSLDLTALLPQLGNGVVQFGVLTGYGWPTDASIELWDVKLRIEP